MFRQKNLDKELPFEVGEWTKPKMLISHVLSEQAQHGHMWLRATGYFHVHK